MSNKVNLSDGYVKCMICSKDEFILKLLPYKSMLCVNCKSYIIIDECVYNVLLSLVNLEVVGGVFKVNKEFLKELVGS